MPGPCTRNRNTVIRAEITHFLIILLFCQKKGRPDLARAAFLVTVHALRKQQQILSFLLYIMLLSDYNSHLFVSWHMPLPVADFFQILSILGNVLFVLYQLIIHFLDQEGTAVA